MKRGLLKWFLIVVVLAAFVGLSQVCKGAGWEASGLTDLGTSMIEVRLGRELGENWTAGILGSYFADDAIHPGKDWGFGGYAKLVVDPNATFPVANWLPKLGDWLDLPESLAAETYLIGKGQVLPYEGEVDIAASFGGGAQVGPVAFEAVYNIIESGDADNPILASGLTLWAGLCFEF